MKKLLIILCLLFFAGCANQNLPLRSQARIGMTFGQVWELYDYDSNDPIGSRKKINFEIIDEHTTENCIVRTYRYWFKNTRKSISTKPVPYLLTFQSCRLPNYDEVQKEKHRRIDRYKEMIINDPNLQQELDTFYEENQLDSENREVLIELLAINFCKDEQKKDFLPSLPPCMTANTLIKITLDQATIRHKQNLEALSKVRPRSYYHSGGNLQIDAYGPGVHMNQYGQPVRLCPDFGGVPGEYLQIKENAYGPGIHMDQYGRPVREYPWP